MNSLQSFTSVAGGRGDGLGFVPVNAEMIAMIVGSAATIDCSNAAQLIAPTACTAFAGTEKLPTTTPDAS